MTSTLDKKQLAILVFAVFPLITSSGGRSPTERGTLFTTPGATIYYEVIGTGPGVPLVIVHGGTPYGHVYLHYSRAIDSLASDRQIVYYDQRGRALSPKLKPGQSCTIADAVADLEALRAHLGIERMDLLGHSYGGFILMAFAARHPERVNRMILVGSAPPRGADLDILNPVMKELFPEAAERLTRLQEAASSGDKSASDGLTRTFIEMMVHSKEKREALLARLLPTPENALRPEVDELMLKDSQQIDLTPELGKFRFPVLIANGRWDAGTTPALAYRVQKAIPGSQVVIFEQSAHFPFFEEPEAFSRKAKEFLR
jgi:proline iminopeptidase